MTRSNDTINVVVTDEPTRRMLQLVLWLLAEEAIQGERWPQYFPEDRDDVYREGRAIVAERVGEYLEVANSLELVDSASVGATVTLSVSTERLVKKVADERQSIDELPAGDVLKSRALREAYAAATRLLDELAPTGAVA